jgi:hypothetical protein
MTPQEKIKIIEEFLDFSIKYLDIKEDPKIKFVGNEKWAKTLHSFGRYRNQPKDITVYLKGRNLADILRTLGHELVHHKQNEMGMMDTRSGDTGSAIENQAHSVAGILMRDFGLKHTEIYESKAIKLGDILKEIKKK